MGAQVFDLDRAAESMQRMRRRGGAHEAHLHQRIADEAARHERADDEVDATFGERFLDAAEHGLDQFDADVGVLVAELGECAQQQPRRKDGVDRQPYFRLPALREPRGRALEAGRVVEQGLATAIQHLAGRCQRGAPALPLEHLQPELILELLDRVSDGRLGAVQALGRLPVTPLFDDRDQGGPLIQRDPGVWHISIPSIGTIEITGFLIQFIDAK